MPFWEGLGYGLAAAFLLGPVFFTLIKASLDHGTAGGVAVAIGIIVSDIIVVAICLTGAIAFIQNATNEAWVSIAAGVILLTLGLRYIVSPKLNVDEQVKLGRKNAVGLFTSGFLVNFVNPFVFVIWIGLSVHAMNAHGAGSGQTTFLIGALAGIFLTDLLKAFFAPKLRRILAPSVLKKVYLFIGIAMLLFSIRVFIHAGSNWG